MQCAVTIWLYELRNCDFESMMTDDYYATAMLCYEYEYEHCRRRNFMSYYVALSIFICTPPLLITYSYLSIVHVHVSIINYYPTDYDSGKLYELCSVCAYGRVIAANGRSLHSIQICNLKSYM